MIVYAAFVIKLSDKLLPILYIVSYISFTFFLISIGIFLIKLLKNHLHDTKQWNIWLTKPQKIMTYREFWKVVNSYNTIRYRIRMIKAVREQQLLIAADKAENFLRKIAQETEKKLQRKNSKTVLKAIILAVSRAKSKTKRHKTLLWLDSTSLDEIIQLLEAIRRINENIL